MKLEWYGSEEDALHYEAGMRTYIERFGSLTAPALDAGVMLRDDDDDERDDNPVQITRYDNLAVLDISGGLASETSRFTRWYGMTTYQDIKERFVNLADDNDIGGILLNFNTNGGNAEGCSLLARFIREYSNKVKPVFSFTGSKAFSAGYWLFAGGARTFMDEDAKIGSVGCIAVHFEVTEMYKQMGIKPRVFRSAPNKALGSPYEKLTDKAAEKMQKDVDFWHVRFVNGIAGLTGLDPTVVGKTIATGDTFDCTEAAERGMVTGVLSFETAVDKLSKVVAKKKPNPASTAAPQHY